MGSLEDKIIRLSPEERRQVEDFIDFLFHKASNALQQPPSGAFLQQNPPSSQTPQNVPQAPVILAEERSVLTPRTPDPLPVLEDLRLKELSGTKKESPLKTRPNKKDPGLLLDWID